MPPRWGPWPEEGGSCFWILAPLVEPNFLGFFDSFHLVDFFWDWGWYLEGPIAASMEDVPRLDETDDFLLRRWNHPQMELRLQQEAK